MCETTCFHNLADHIEMKSFSHEQSNLWLIIQVHVLLYDYNVYIGT